MTPTKSTTAMKEDHNPTWRERLIDRYEWFYHLDDFLSRRGSDLLLTALGLSIAVCLVVLAVLILT